MRSVRDLKQRAMKLDVIICGCAEASEYNPYIVFQMQIRKGIVVGLHLGYPLRKIAKSLNVSMEEVSSHIKLLKKAELVTEKDGCIVPAFFVALKEDVLKVKTAAKHLGAELAKCYEAGWDAVTETYSKLSVSKRFDFDRVSFVLIGAYSLDMIDKFAEEGKIVPKAPARKAGSFYMWGVEDGMDALGRYVMHSGLVADYGFATFGREKRERERRRRITGLKF